MEPQRSHTTPAAPQSHPAAPQSRSLWQVAAPATSFDSVWLLPEMLQRIASSLPPNEVALTLRLVNKAAAAQFQHATVRLSQPVPHHAFVSRWAGPGAVRELVWSQRKQLPCLVARSGSIANLEVLLARDDLPSDMYYSIAHDAAAAGQLDVCVWLRERGCLWSEVALTAAAKGGHQALCEWLVPVCPDNLHLVAAAASAAEGGHVGLMEWLRLAAQTHGADGSDVRQALDASDPVYNSLLEGAAAGCDLATLQRLHHIHVDSRAAPEPNSDDPDGEMAYKEREGNYLWNIIEHAAGSATADWQAKVEWLEAQGYPLNQDSYIRAAGQPDGRARVQWLRQRGYPLDMGVADSAAQAGDMELLEYVLGQGVEVDVSSGMMDEVVLSGDVAVMELLHARGAPIGKSTVIKAAECGHLPAVAWLVERLAAAGGALSAGVFSAAAGAGSMELMAWLRQQGCPWDAATFVAAAGGGGSEEQLEWLAGQGCPMGDDGEPYARAAASGNMAALRCLRCLGCPWSTHRAVVDRVNRIHHHSPFGEHVERALAWLLEQGLPR
ncbi:hypothetical protein TSOC_012174 [Tetrabaena socialis]|uniref:Ankyrin repeat domain-containing protein n=1 Tax=Tetrabaena socialis TaxID=47790 RepID=A0A2J7ZNP9_9CHLO|nr:hypothetical protein TSOC_012174 [Tetrabaena socialis]|eukprot:PNH01891.1 hypothetical protein TSOC_012174 [Tetrabaena socialis]